jgi:anti-sigma-K factor RskA
MTHDELKDALSALALGALDSAERIEVEAHVRGCAECQAELQALLKVVDGIGLEASPVTPPDLLKSKVLSRIELERVNAGSQLRTLPPAGGRPVVAAPKPAGSWMMPLALAASLVLAAAALLYAFRMQTEVEELRKTARILQSADLVRANMKGQTSAPNATGLALWSKANGMLFSATQLPKLPPGRVYQLWTITGTTATSAGLLTPDASGAVRLELPVPANAARPDAFGVTVEPAGGSPAPTLPIVLLGSAGQ